jgi:hypothetical protein
MQELADFLMRDVEEVEAKAAEAELTMAEGRRLVGKVCTAD